MASGKQNLRAAAAVVLGLGAVAYAVMTFVGRPAPGEQGFFYDASAGRLFKGPRDAAPPIRGVDGPEEDGYRAVVFSATGKPSDRDSWKVAYLEKFSPELRQKMTAAQKSGEPLSMGRIEAQTQRFVKRVEDTEWRAMSSPEAEVILSEWTRAGTGDATPVVCTP